MVTLSMCRICLAEDLRMQTVMNTHLEEIFQSLSLMPFATRDSRPMLACFFCCAKLQKCYELRKNILRSEQLFTQILRNDVIVPPELDGIFHKNRLRITQVVDISVGINEQKKEHVEIEVPSPETICGSSVKLEIPDSIFSNIVGTNEQMKEHVEIEVLNPETIDVSTVKVEVPEVFENDPLEGDKDNLSLDIVKKEKDDITTIHSNKITESAEESYFEGDLCLQSLKEEPEDVPLFADVYQYQQQTQQQSQLNIQATQSRPCSNAERQRRYRRKKKADKLNAYTTFSQSRDVQLQQEQPQHDVQINKSQPLSNAERQRKYRKLLREQQKQQQSKVNNAITVLSNTPHTSSIHQLQNTIQMEVVADVYQQQTQQKSQNKQSKQTLQCSNAERQRRYREKRKAFRMNACTTFSQSNVQLQEQPQHEVQIKRRQPQSNAERQKRYRERRKAHKMNCSCSAKLYTTCI